MCYRVALSFCLSVALTTIVVAQDLPKTNVKVIGLNSPTPVSIYDELPFWRKTIPEASKGAITADITPLDQMGIDDKTMLRLLKLGVIRRDGHEHAPSAELLEVEVLLAEELDRLAEAQAPGRHGARP